MILLDCNKDAKSEWKGPVFLTVDDLCQMLQISESLAYKMIREKMVPFYRINNKTVRFNLEEIKAWLQERKGAEYHIECIRRSPGRPKKQITGVGSEGERTIYHE